MNYEEPEILELGLAEDLIWGNGGPKMEGPPNGKSCWKENCVGLEYDELI
jgi:hypothetical protein